MDITKAFDRVWHKGLLHKLKGIGICGTLFEWFKCYLSDRSQQVVLENHFSQWARILAGVPQGSILGPLLFLIFLRDIENNVVSDMSMFADDTALLHVFHDANNANVIINNDLITLQHWADAWMVKFNPLKTKFMLISNKRSKSNIDISLNNNIIEKVATYRHLGMLFSEDLKWSKHISCLANKTKMKIGALFRTRDKILRKDKCKIYTTIIRPALEYGNVIYDNCSLSDSMKLESAQTYATQVCTGAMKRTNNSKLLEELKWQTLKTRRQMHKNVLTFKILKDRAPNYLKTNFMLNSSKIRNLRRIDPLVYPKIRLNTFANSFFPMQTKMWNNLPHDLVLTDSLLIFKNWLIKKYCNFADNFDDSIAFSTCSSYHGKILTQIRLGLSPLRQQLFVHDIIENPICPSCGNDIESAEHFFLLCQIYSTQRIILFQHLSTLIINWTNYKNIDTINILVKGQLLTSLNNVTTTNILIFNAVQHYMLATKRFLY